ncbi:hypothetical protein FOMPIDRAFT_1024024, partial [Fomitopsis schrenkii]
MKLSEVDPQPGLRLLYELLKPIISPDVDAPQREYPSAGFLNATSLFVSDGYGTLYALLIPSTGSAIEARQGVVPFRIHNVAQTTEEEAVLILSSKHYPKETLPPVMAPQTAATLRPTGQGSTSGRCDAAYSCCPLDILWHRRGDNVPIYTLYDADRRSFMLVINNSVGRTFGQTEVGP